MKGSRKCSALQQQKVWGEDVKTGCGKQEAKDRTCKTGSIGKKGDNRIIKQGTQRRRK